MNNSKGISRRTFLKWTGITTTIMVLDPPLRNLKLAYAFGEHPQEKAPYLVKKKIPQVCARACECDCQYDVVVGVDQITGLERALTIEGRPDDPVARGKFCIKALGFVDGMYNPDRLLVTLKRTNPQRGQDVDPGWVTVKSEDAVKEIIEKMKTYKPEEMLFASPGDPYSNRLCRSLGVTRSDQRTECFGTHYYLNSLMITNPPNKYYSSTYTMTHSIWGFDYDEAKYMLWFGFDSFSKTAKAGILNHIAEGKRKGNKIVFFNPIRTPITDGMADEYYAIKPGTDLAVALSMIKTIVDEKLYQTDFLKEYTDAGALIDTKTGKRLADEKGAWLVWSTADKKAVPVKECSTVAFDGGPFKVEISGQTVNAKPVLQILQENVTECTPEWAEKISEVPGADIARIAREFAAAAPMVCIPNLKRDPAGPNYANSWRLMQSINILHALTGSLDHEGGVLFLHGVKIPWLEETDPIPKPYPEQPAEAIDFRTEFPVTNDIYRNRDFCAPGHYGMVGYGLYHSDRVKMVFFKGPHRGLHALIQPQMTEAALLKMDLVVDWNLYPDDNAYWCDYVLPAPHQYEDYKLDIRQYYPKWPCLVGGSPVQKPPGDAIGWGKIASMIGFALAPEYWTTDGSNNPDKIIKGNMKDPALQALGAATDRDDFLENKNAFWIDKKDYENYKTIKEISYGRPDGRIKMYVDEFVDVGFNGLPEFASRWTSPEGEYQFSLLVTRAGWHMHADPNFIDNPVINMLSQKNYTDCVWISPAAGEKLGLNNGDEVIVETNPKYMPELPRPVKSKVYMTTRISRDDCILLFHGIGHRSKWLKHGVWGYRDGDLIPQKNPQMSKQYDPTGMGWVEDVYVRIQKA